MRVALSNVGISDEINYLESYRFSHMGLAYLAAVLVEFGHSVKVVDAFEHAMTIEEFVESLRSFSPEIVGFTSYTSTERWLKTALGRIKGARRPPVTVIGGVHAAFRGERFLRDGLADVVFFGEAEATLSDFCALVERYGGQLPPARALREIAGIGFLVEGRFERTHLQTFPDLEALPFPLFELTGERDWMPEIPIMASRGCLGRCTFCSAHQYFRFNRGKAVRSRSPESVVAEMRHRLRHRTVGHFMFVDDDLLLNEVVSPGWMRKLGALLVKEGLAITFGGKASADTLIAHAALLPDLRQMGLRGFFVGFESNDPKTLRSLFRKRATVDDNRAAAKLLAEAGLHCVPGMIPFHPYATPASLLHDWTFVRTIPIDPSNTSFAFHRYNKLLLFPGCDALIARVEADGLLDDADGMPGFRFAEPLAAVVWEEMQRYDRETHPKYKRMLGLLGRQAFGEAARTRAEFDRYTDAVLAAAFDHEKRGLGAEGLRQSLRALAHEQREGGADAAEG